MNKSISTGSANRIFVLFISIAVMLLLAYQNAYAFGADSDRSREIKERTEKILASEEFQEKEKKKTVIETMAIGVKEVVEKLKEKLKELMNRIKLPDLNSPKDFSKPGAATLAMLKTIGIAIIVSVVIFVFYLTSRNFRATRKVRKKEDQEMLVSLKDAQFVEEKAYEYADKGDFRQGIRYLYIALLLNLNESNLIRIQKSKTNKQYMLELRNNSFSQIDTATGFTHDFNRFWYGNKRAEKNNFEYCRSIYDLLKKEVAT